MVSSGEGAAPAALDALVAAQRRAGNPRLVRESERRRERDVLDEAEGRMPVAAGRELVMDDACARPGGEDIACAAAPPTRAT